MLQIQTIPCFSDNLSYLLVETESKTCVIVDPGEAKPFVEAIKAQKLNLVAVLATHHHYDHVGGLSELGRESWTSASVISSQRDLNRIPGIGGKGPRGALANGETMTWSSLASSSEEISFTALEIPGHTEGQVAFVVQSQSLGTDVFVGDTLFSLGCGRCLEGTPEILFESLQKIKCLPMASRIHFGHEYTEKNSLFWLSLQGRYSETEIDFEQIKNNLVEFGKQSLPRPAPTLESQIQLNPFLKTKNANEFRRWRDLRDNF